MNSDWTGLGSGYLLRPKPHPASRRPLSLPARSTAASNSILERDSQTWFLSLLGYPVIRRALFPGLSATRTLLSGGTSSLGVEQEREAGSKRTSPIGRGCAGADRMVGVPRETGGGARRAGPESEGAERALWAGLDPARRGVGGT